MESTANLSNEVPTALPGFEDDDAREKLLLETAADETDVELDDEETDVVNEVETPKSSRGRLLRTIAGFAIFVCVLVLAVAWFFGMGWFAQQKAQPVSRNASKDASTSPVTEDEKLKMALSMVAAKDPRNTGNLDVQPASEETAPPPEISTAETTALAPDGSSATSVDRARGATSLDNVPSYSLTSATEKLTQKDKAADGSSPALVKDHARVAPIAPAVSTSGEAPGRSLFFGIAKNPQPSATLVEAKENKSAQPLRKQTATTLMPFGLMLPVRLVGSIYTFRNSGGFVRLELTRSVEGKGFSYPAGTIVVGNARGGESDRAFVTIVGLIDPASGELVRFGGELMGRDGGSGIEGRRRKLTSGWSRFFAGLKDTAGSVLSSVGALRSGGTVILSEPFRRGSESATEDLSAAILRNGKDGSFIEVPAGTNGYVLVTGLPENESATNRASVPEVDSK